VWYDVYERLLPMERRHQLVQTKQQLQSGRGRAKSRNAPKGSRRT
jgi:hypothetical protein